MKLKRFSIVLMVMVLVMGLLMVTLAFAQGGESQEEIDKAAAAETAVPPERNPVSTNPENMGGGGFQLFAGLDDVTVPAFRIDPATNLSQTVFTGVEVWGAAYDPDNDVVYIVDGTTLWEWPVGGTPALLGTITAPTGSSLSAVGAAFYDGQLFIYTASVTEGIWIVDPTTQDATLHIATASPTDADCGGLAAHPLNGTFYCTNDDSSAPGGAGLAIFNNDGTLTLVSSYPAGETDVDGLAVGSDDIAYLITDDPTPPEIYRYDLVAGAYITSLVTPFTTTEVFAGGAWIEKAGLQLEKTVGTDPSSCATTTSLVVEPGTDVYYCYEVTNSSEITVSLHDLTDSELGQLIAGFVYDLGPGASVDTVAAGLTISATILTDTMNTATWTAYNAGPTDVMSATASAEVLINRASISLAKTVGTDPNVCSALDSVTVPSGTDVTYCYDVTNTGDLTLTLHDLNDSEIGSILSSFPYTLTPGASVFVTVTSNITESTVNTATWTAYNAGPVDVAMAEDSATVNVLDSAPFGTCVDFESGALPSFMYPTTTINGTSNGRVVVTDTFPFNGTYAMNIDTECNGACSPNTLQSGTMVVDLAGQTNVLLDFWVQEHGDENNVEDGVFISDDSGATWAQILSLNNFPSSYTNVQVDLVAAAAGAGMSLVDGFQIRFQSFDNFSIPTDGYSFDDICVQEDVPHIDLTKTVGTDPNACAASSNISVPVGTDVTYCYDVTNTGNFTLTVHDLDDSELGSILSGFPFTLTPGSGTFLTVTTNIVTDTVNSALWTAYNPGPTDVVTATDTATVTVLFLPDIEVDPDNLSETLPPNMQATQPITISNVGDADLDWTVVEEAAPVMPPGPPSVNPGEPPVVQSAEECELYENYAGAEPEGYAEFCGQLPLNPWTSSNLDPTDTAFALDIRNGNFVSHVLNDFAGQTILGANSQSIFAMDFDPTGTTLYAIDNTSRELGTLNLANGVFTPIAVVSGIPGADNISGLTIDPVTGNAYVSGLNSGGTLFTLYSLDLGSAVATSIGSDASVPFMIDISVGPQGVMYGHDISTDSIYTIDMSTGTATLVGLTGVNSNFAQGIDFDNADGTLYAYTYQGTGANQYGTIDLATGALTPLSIDNPLGEFEGATQTVGGQPCAASDIPWASASPTSGTTAPGGSTVVDVTFDSTGLSTGVYTGTLCIESNDPVDPQVRVPLTLTVLPAVPSIAMTKTVGLDSATCATSSSLTVPAGGGGTVVYYCYTVMNTGDITLPFHDLDDDKLGNIFTGLVYDLGPGQSVDTVAAGLVISANITETTTNVATWTAFADSQTTASATSSATVTQGTPTSVSLTGVKGGPSALILPVMLALLITLVFGGLTIIHKLQSRAEM